MVAKGGGHLEGADSGKGKEVANTKVGDALLASAQPPTDTSAVRNGANPAYEAQATARVETSIKSGAFASNYSEWAQRNTGTEGVRSAAQTYDQMINGWPNKQAQIERMTTV